MTTGIYELKFTEKIVYIGQAKDIEKRITQHMNDFTRGTHSKTMQAAYNKYGKPFAGILHICAPYLLDTLEAAYIHSRKRIGKTLLNSIIPEEPNKADLDIILRNEKRLHKLSIADLYRRIEKYEGSTKIKSPSIEPYEYRGTYDSYVREGKISQFGAEMLERSDRRREAIRAEKENKSLINRFFKWLFN